MDTGEAVGVRGRVSCGRLSFSPRGRASRARQGMDGGGAGAHHHDLGPPRLISVLRVLKVDEDVHVDGYHHHRAHARHQDEEPVVPVGRHDGDGEGESRGFVQKMPGMRGRRRRGGRALRDADDTARLERRFATCARGALACDPA